MPSLFFSLLSFPFSLQNPQKCRFEPTFKKSSNHKASRAKIPYFMRLFARTKRPENGTILPDLYTMTKRLEISLRAIAHGFESHPLRQRNPHKPSVYAGFLYIYCCCKKVRIIYIGEQISMRIAQFVPQWYIRIFELSKNERAPKSG